MSHSRLYLNSICQLLTTDHFACHSTVGVSNDASDLLWHAIVSQQCPEALSVQTVKCLLQINKADTQRGFHLHAVLQSGLCRRCPRESQATGSEAEGQLYLSYCSVALY